MATPHTRQEAIKIEPMADVHNPQQAQDKIKLNNLITLNKQHRRARIHSHQVTVKFSSVREIGGERGGGE